MQALERRLQELERGRQELGEEFIILKSNYLALGRELDKEVMRNEELTQELLSLAKGSSHPPGSAHPSCPGLGGGGAAGHPRSARRGKPEDAAASEHEQQELQRNPSASSSSSFVPQLLGNQDHIKVELEKLKKTHDEQQQKLEERVLALGKELQEAKGAAGDSRHRLAQQSAVLLTSQSQLREVEAENSRLQLQLKELNEEYRSRLAQHIRDLANYMDSKPSSVTGPSRAPAGHAAMKNFVDSMLGDIRASYRSREEQLARAARGYKKRMKDLAKKHENLLIAYGLQREQIRTLGTSAMDCGPAELHLSITDPELLSNSSRELNRLRHEKAKLETQLQELQQVGRELGLGGKGPISPFLKAFVGLVRLEKLSQISESNHSPNTAKAATEPAQGETGQSLEQPGMVEGAGFVSGHDPNELFCHRQLDEEGWAEVRKKLREFTLNTQEDLEQQRSQLLTRAVAAEEQVSELQGYIDQHLAR
ncbi:Coiled-coil domain-containing protein 78 [Lonchura striata]|uniref:Coiled-coil domain-containing protein 78 n=1 Tax=Lonchura striata TaxID=40157 RepID=A0A218UQ46_9PASE|nr:Coiled-coil domain-containing protein 78 [Lonchura striata domestica]